MTLAQAEPQSAPADPVDHGLQLSEGTFRCVRMHEADDTDAVSGTVIWKPARSLWISAMTLAALLGGPVYFTWGAYHLPLLLRAKTRQSTLRTYGAAQAVVARFAPACATIQRKTNSFDSSWAS
jgi:hypothetical protein